MALMTRFRKSSVNAILGAVAFAAASLLVVPSAVADKITLKNGTVLEGKIQREESSFVFITITVNGKEETRVLSKADIDKIVRDADAPKADPKPAPAPEPKPEVKSNPPKEDAPPAAAPKPEAAKDAPAADKPKDKASEKAAKTLTGRPTRVAFLNFGPPSSWQGKIDNTVGIQISVSAWADAIPLLEKDKIDVVVVRINSGGGLALEVPRFHDLYENQYKKRFRTVAWIESAISAAAMAPWVLEEMYFLPEGNIGACTMFSGPLIAAKGIQLEDVLAMMERASAMAKRDPKIMRSMQIQEPLSVDWDENGNVVWHQDLTGKRIINPATEVLTITASVAMDTGFARGVAATPDELCKVMGLSEYEIVGQEASKFIDRNMEESDHTEKKFEEAYVKYGIAVNAAAGAPDRAARATQVGVARRHLQTLKRMVSVNPNFSFMFPTNDKWFEEQEEILRELLK